MHRIVRYCLKTMKREDTKKTAVKSSGRPEPAADATKSAGFRKWRMLVLIILFAVVAAVYTVTLVRIVNDRAAPEKQPEKTYVRTSKIYSVRGEIFDRNGKPLVTNEYSYSLVLEYGGMAPTYQQENEELLKLFEAIDRAGRRKDLKFDYCPFIGTYPALYFDSVLCGTPAVSSRLSRIKKDLSLPEDSGAEDLAAALCVKYSITDKNGEPRYSGSETTDLLFIRYEMEAEQFAPDQPLYLLRELTEEEITAFSETKIVAIGIKPEVSRVYGYPGRASHIIGRTGKIFSEDVDYYVSLGYPANATVGIDGVEKAFESILHGVDGIKEIEYDADGMIVAERTVREPVNGKDIYLTIDIDLQGAAEEALRSNISKISREAIANNQKNEGEDCDCGAIVVQNVSDGAILALASYPSFDLSTFGTDYPELAKDPLKPLFNRALEGTYAPGSTYKVCVAAGALMDGTIMADGSAFSAGTIIDTKGKYTYYDDYQPACWLYAYGQASHGPITVTKAIEVSCNYFFYELGRQMGINRISEHSKEFGLGQNTGIELPEAIGNLSDRNYAESNGITWTGGLTIATAIGQAYSKFTPIQLAGYLATVLNSGKRYASHLLLSSKYYDGSGYEIFQPVVLSDSVMSRSVRDVLVNAMSRVVDENASVTAFDGFDVKVGGKTGTAEVAGQSPNGVFIGFAPLNDPEISVACVLEKGAHGYNAAFPVRDVMEAYFHGAEGNYDNEN